MEFGLTIAKGFVKHAMALRKRRKAKQDGYCPILKDDLIGAIEGLAYISELHY